MLNELRTTSHHNTNANVLCQWTLHKFHYSFYEEPHKVLQKALREHFLIIHFPDEEANSSGSEYLLALEELVDHI